MNQLRVRPGAVNAQRLRTRFAEQVLVRYPKSVLDVGCGAGALLEVFRAAGVHALGIETKSERVAELRAAGLAALCAEADALPLADASFDWVISRHVLHHVLHPERLVREAARVARTGLVLAEPWRDPAFPEQRLGLALDDWSKRQDRRLGRVHGADHTLSQIASFLPGSGWHLEFEQRLEPALLPLEEVEATIATRLIGLSPEDADHARAEELLARAREHGVGVNGSAVVLAQRLG